MRDGSHLMRPWLERLVADLAPLELFDAHTHIGANDPDGFTQTPQELLEHLEAARSRGVVFPMHEPAGYRAANDTALAAAEASEGRLVSFCRVDPRDGAVAEATRALDRGARGIKLHPRAEGFGLDEPGVHALFGLAAERRVPVLIHAGRGIPALGQRTLELNSEHPEAPVILAHAAISDMAWMWRHAGDHPTLFVDTSWWMASDLLALFAYFPPGQILFASDAPYGSPILGAILTLRCGLQAGLDAGAARSVAGGQLERLLAGETPLELGPAPGPRPSGLDPLLDRLANHLAIGMGRELTLPGAGEEGVALARLAADVGEGSPLAGVCEQVVALLDAYEGHRARPDRLAFSELWLLALAQCVARTPDVGLADLSG